MMPFAKEETISQISKKNLKNITSVTDRSEKRRNTGADPGDSAGKSGPGNYRHYADKILL